MSRVVGSNVVVEGGDGTTRSAYTWRTIPCTEWVGGGGEGISGGSGRPAGGREVSDRRRITVGNGRMAPECLSAGRRGNNDLGGCGG